METKAESSGLQPYDPVQWNVNISTGNEFIFYWLCWGRASGVDKIQVAYPGVQKTGVKTKAQVDLRKNCKYWFLFFTT